MPPKPTRHNTPDSEPGGDWRTRAACLKTDPELFFPVGNSGFDMEQTTRAKRVCKMCTVAFECLEFAIDTNTNFGVFGGLSEDERRTLRRRRLSRSAWDSVIQQSLDRV